MELDEIKENISIIIEKQQEIEVVLARHQEHEESMLRQILDRVTRTNGSVASAHVLIEQNRIDAHRNWLDNRDNITKLDIWKNRVQGAWAAVVAVALILGTVIGALSSYFLAQ